MPPYEFTFASSMAALRSSSASGLPSAAGSASSSSVSGPSPSNASGLAVLAATASLAAASNNALAPASGLPSAAGSASSSSVSGPSPSNASGLAVLAATASNMPLQTPPEKAYQSLEAAESDIDRFAKQHGYAVARSRSKMNKSGTEIRKVWLRCIHGGKYKPNGHGTRPKTGTLRTGCTWEATIQRIAVPGTEDHIWRFAAKNGEHTNHQMAEDPAAYASHRTLKMNHIEDIKDLTNAGSTPKVILATLRQSDPDCLAVSRDIYNAKAKARNQGLNGRRPIEALLDLLTEENVCHEFEQNEEGRLTRLFIAPKTAISLARKNSANAIFVMDATYKTNRYNMPLLHIVGVTPTNKTVSLAYCFLSAECEADYIWALQKFKRCFGEIIDQHNITIVVDRELALMAGIRRALPDAQILICIWHINKNVQAKVKSQFETGDHYEKFWAAWTELCASSTEKEYDENWIRMQNSVPRTVTQYLESTWLRDHRKKFIKAWTNTVVHFGHASTSRVEGSHSYLKQWIMVSTSDLLQVYSKMVLASEAQRREISQQISLERLRIPIRLQSPFWSLVVRKVSTYALFKAYEQYQMACSEEVDNQECTGTMQKSLGIPCWHQIKTMLDNETRPDVADFHKHWWLQQPVTPSPTEQRELPFNELLGVISKQHEESDPQEQLRLRSVLTHIDSVAVQEPSIVNVRGRPSAKSGNSTRRDPSLFERVEAASRPKRKCTNCDQEGHNKRTCTHQLRRMAVVTESRTNTNSKTTEIDEYEDDDEEDEENRLVDRRFADEVKIKNDVLSNRIQFHPLMREYIEVVTDVTGDGNCGYRSVAVSLGYNEHEWPTIRSTMRNELLERQAYYQTLFVDEYEDLLFRLSFGENGPCLRRHWMRMPIMGEVIANAFDRPLFLFTLDGNNTFFPHKSKANQNKALTIAFVGNCHFVALQLCPEFPVPPVSKYWQRLADPIARTWVTPFEDRAEAYRLLLLKSRPQNAQQECIDLTAYDYDHEMSRSTAWLDSTPFPLFCVMCGSIVHIACPLCYGPLCGKHAETVCEDHTDVTGNAETAYEDQSTDVTKPVFVSQSRRRKLVTDGTVRKSATKRATVNGTRTNRTGKNNGMVTGTRNLTNRSGNRGEGEGEIEDNLATTITDQPPNHLQVHLLQLVRDAGDDSHLVGHLHNYAISTFVRLTSKSIPGIETATLEDLVWAMGKEAIHSRLETEVEQYVTMVATYIEQKAECGVANCMPLPLNMNDPARHKRGKNTQAKRGKCGACGMLGHRRDNLYCPIAGSLSMAEVFGSESDQ